MHLPVIWSKIFRDIVGNPARSGLVILSIAAGLFAIGGTANAGLTISREMNIQYPATHPASATYHLSEFDEELIAAVEAQRGITGIEARRVEPVQVVDEREKVRNIELIVPQDYDPVRLNQFEILEGETAPGLREIFLERKTAEWLGVESGDALTLQIDGAEERSYSLQVTGIVHDLHQFLPMWMEVGTGYVSMDTLHWMGFDAAYNELLVTTASPLDKDSVRAITEDIRERVIEPAGYTVYGIERGDPGKHWGADMLSAMLIVFQVVGLICIVISAGLVTNTVSAQVLRQIRLIGVMRTYGGVRARIAWSYIITTLVYSIVAMGIAIPLGRYGALIITNAVSSMLNFDVPAAGVPLPVALIQVAIGLLVPVGAVIGPVMVGTGIPIAQAVNQDGNIGTVKMGLVAAVLRRLEGLPRPLILAIRNTFRRKTRLALTLGTLTIAGAMFMAAFSTHLMLRDKMLSVANYFQYDVSLSVSTGANIQTVEREALRLPGVELAEGWYSTGGAASTVGGTDTEDVDMVGVPVDTETMTPRLVEGRWLEAGDGNAVVVTEDLLDDLPGLAVGGDLVVTMENGDQDYREVYTVIGIATQQIFNTQAYVSYDVLTRQVDAPNRVSEIRVRASQGDYLSADEQEALGERLAEQFEKNGWGHGTPDTRSAVYLSNMSNFDPVLYSLTGMAALLAFVGGLGLAGTMSLNVIERTREIGVIRAVGGSDGAVRLIIVFEGLFVGLLSWMLSALLSLPMSYWLANILCEALLSGSVQYHISMPGIWMWLALVLAIGAAASLVPAQYAARLTIREILAYE